MELTVWGIITALFVGLIIGALGRLVVPGRQDMPIWLHMIIGVGAALLGTVLARAMGIATATAGIDWAELAVQVALAAIAVAVVAGVGSRRRGVTHR
ncbi:GlsB/YeaQ/YmgE family stress response membrane protein [Micromonospora lutea]|uniref:Transglycosylase n=1 Tax=Micromonospora lutea TaxID=419825 RepID=A0ABQ4IST6_9ACTN|nr:GlsB/YeaQ/YmgE family stress response membrane protein [Micromonospora lutea]GIJ20997.1 transglycosylase [Micromonospora lutea]